MVKNKIEIIFILFTLFSCSSLKKEDIKGVYNYKSKISLGRLSITDSVFEFEYQAPFENYSSKGTWSYSKKYLTLKSYDSYKSGFIEVTEMTTSTGYIEVLDRYRYPISNVNITIDGKQSKFSTDSMGRVYLNNNENPKNIQVHFIGLLETYNHYIVKSDKSNTFIVVMYDRNYQKKYFDFDKVKINKNKALIDKQLFIKD